MITALTSTVGMGTLPQGRSVIVIITDKKTFADNDNTEDLHVYY